MPWPRIQLFSLFLNNKGMQIKLKTIGDSVVINTRSKSTGACERLTIETGLRGERTQLIGRTNRMSTASSADHHTKLRETRIEAALQRTQHRRSDTGGMPVHTHHSTE